MEANKIRIMEIQINNNLRDRAYNNACKHGFHDKEYSDEHWLMLIITEIGEAVNADRKGKRADIEEFNKTTKITDFGFMRTFERYIKDSVEDELADVVIRCLDFLGKIGFDLSETQEILEYSESDPCPEETCIITEVMYNITSLLYSSREVGLRVQDVIIQIFGLSEHIGIDLLWFIEQKMRYNELRIPMHGKKY